ncbi:hypothetical protein [Streptomyces pilosus]|uniref:Uncharacterized protein n=1 Tax=Streptomyces pilosus TaxID=28893 RepID=A0A918C6P1_9ACTN|nr:hypothetical protein [Streptomyces pilosus]GGR08414.1 hypothetical protein GCM10010280_65310 [Streptomyces pilosus]
MAVPHGPGSLDEEETAEGRFGGGERGAESRWPYRLPAQYGGEVLLEFVGRYPLAAPVQLGEGHERQALQFLLDEGGRGLVGDCVKSRLADFAPSEARR